MGNRAVLTFGTKENYLDNVGIYLHWNGGPKSVQAFLTYCKFKNYPTDDYGIARLAQVIGNYFGGNSSIGIDICQKLDCNNWDNGVYFIKDWEVVDSLYDDNRRTEDYDVFEFLLTIDRSMPKHEQLGADVIAAKWKEE